MGRLLKFLVVLGVLGLLALLGLAHAKRALDAYFHRGSTVTPSVVGKTLEEAVEASALTVKIASRVASAEVPAGRIVAQDPSPGTPVHASRPLLVVLSGGATMVDVPEIAGQPLRKAKLTLSDARLAVGHISSMTNRQPRDTVLAQYPAAGGKLGKGGAVDLLLSTGPPAQSPVVPRVTGRPEPRARELLEQFGFRQIEVEVRAGPPDAAPGTVFDQDPPPGAATDASQRVVLRVAAATSVEDSPEATAAAAQGLKRLTAQFTMPPGLVAKRLDVYLSDSVQARRAIYSKSHEPGEHVAIPVEGTGLLELEFFVDDVAYGRQQL
ncbi:MAG: PASTA domain-containing protein [Candidatus Wallbacteria bacterium]|nr:PASTA domain-containing protein [Candidatus Wallbacteria bacterium]